MAKDNEMSKASEVIDRGDPNEILWTRRLREPHRHIYDPSRVHFPDHPVGKYGLCELCAQLADHELHVGEPISRFDGGWEQWESSDA